MTSMDQRRRQVENSIAEHPHRKKRKMILGQIYIIEQMKPEQNHEVVNEERGNSTKTSSLNQRTRKAKECRSGKTRTQKKQKSATNTTNNWLEEKEDEQRAYSIMGFGLGLGAIVIPIMRKTKQDMNETEEKTKEE